MMFDDIKAAIFDLDGTLVDSMYVWKKVDEDFLTARGIPTSEDYTDKMRTMFFETAAAYTKETYKLDESVEEIMQVWLDMAHYEYANNVRAKKGALEFLLSMKEKGIVLNEPSVVAVKTENQQKSVNREPKLILNMRNI